MAKASKVTDKSIVAGGTKGAVVPDVYLKCEMCQGPLPCESCARIFREQFKLTGKEPEGESDADELDLDPGVAAAAQKIRDEGFTGLASRGVRRNQFYPPWSAQDYRARHFESVEVSLPTVNYDDVVHGKGHRKQKK